MIMFSGINPLPMWRDLKNYRLDLLRRDSVAALGVALLALPQAMAYAFMADLPASAGIWSVIFGTILTASLGHSRALVSGTTNAIAILIQSGTSEILSTYYRGVLGVPREVLALNIVLQLVFLMGIFQIVASFLRLGRLTQFTSRSVIVGYMTAAAVAIVVTQLFPFFGMQEMEEYHPLYQQGWFFLSHLYTFNPAALLVAIGSLFILIFLYRVSEKIPAAAIAFIASAAVVIFFKLSSVTLLQDVLPFESITPSLTLPFFDIRILGQLIPLAFALTLISVLEATAIGRSYASVKDPFYHDNQEIYGLGMSNLFAAFLGGMPNAGSFSRSALNVASGAKTRFAAILSGLFVYILVVTFNQWVGKIPVAALSALMIFTAYTMVNFRDLSLCVRATRGDSVVVLATFISSWFFTLDVVLYIGILLSIVLYLKKAAVPFLIEYTFNSQGKLRPVGEEGSRLDPRIGIFQAEGELFFGAADPLQTKLHQIAEDENIRVVILQLLNTRHLDASVCLALKNIYYYLKGSGRHLILTGISQDVWYVLEDTGLIALFGHDNCFHAKERLPGEPTREAYAYAKTLILN